MSNEQTIADMMALSDEQFEKTICEGIRQQLVASSDRELREAFHISQAQAMQLRRLLRRYQRYASA